MVRAFILVIALIFGLYAYEVYSGDDIGVERMFRNIGYSVLDFTGMAWQDG